MGLGPLYCACTKRNAHPMQGRFVKTSALEAAGRGQQGAAGLAGKAEADKAMPDQEPDEEDEPFSSDDDEPDT